MSRCTDMYCPHIQCELQQGHETQGINHKSAGLRWDQGVTGVPELSSLSGGKEEQDAWESYSSIPSDIKGGMKFGVEERIAHSAGWQACERFLAAMAIPTLIPPPMEEEDEGLLQVVNKACNKLGM